MKRGLEGFHLVIASRRMRYDNPYACSPRTGSFEYGGTLAACRHVPSDPLAARSMTQTTVTLLWNPGRA